MHAPLAVPLMGVDTLPHCTSSEADAHQGNSPFFVSATRNRTTPPSRAVLTISWTALRGGGGMGVAGLLERRREAGRAEPGRETRLAGRASQATSPRDRPGFVRGSTSMGGDEGSARRCRTQPRTPHPPVPPPGAARTFWLTHVPPPNASRASCGSAGPRRRPPCRSPCATSGISSSLCVSPSGEKSESPHRRRLAQRSRARIVHHVADHRRGRSFGHRSEGLQPTGNETFGPIAPWRHLHLPNARKTAKPRANHAAACTVRPSSGATRHRGGFSRRSFFR